MKHRLLIPKGHGFFAEFVGVITGIREAEIKGQIPVPFWVKDQFLFHNPERGPNAWEHFFEPTYTEDFDDIAVMPCDLEKTKYCWWHMTHHKNMGKRQTAHKVIEKWIKVKPEIQAQVDDFYNEHMQGKVLGLHIRTTDRATTNVHARLFRFVGLDHFCKEIDLYLEKYPDNKIFLATDSHEIVDDISRRYDNVITQDTIRSTNETSIHGEVDEGIEGDPYLKGVDVLTDAMLLSKTDFLIRSCSNVSAVSLCMNLDLNYIDMNYEVDGQDVEHKWLSI